MTFGYAPQTYAPADRAAALRSWRAAAAVRRITGSYLWEIGASITVGSGSTDAMTRGWRACLASNLRARLPQSATGGAGYFSVDFAVPSGGALVQANFGPGYVHGIMGAPTDKFTFSNIVGTSFDVVWPRGGGGTLGVQIDGGTVNNVNQTGTLVDAQTTRFALTGGTHTITLNAVSGTTFASGLFVYNGDETVGIRHVAAGHYGATAKSFVDNSITPGYFASQLAAFPPSLVILDFGANDAITSGMTANVFDQYMRVIVNTLNALTAPPTIIIPFWPRRSDGTFTQTYDDYWTAITKIEADYMRVIALDMRPYMGSAVQADTYGLFADTVHPSDKGHGLIADVITTIIADPIV